MITGITRTWSQGLQGHDHKYHKDMITRVTRTWSQGLHRHDNRDYKDMISGITRTWSQGLQGHDHNDYKDIRSYSFISLPQAHSTLPISNIITYMLGLLDLYILIWKFKSLECCLLYVYSHWHPLWYCRIILLWRNRRLLSQKHNGVSWLSSFVMSLHWKVWIKAWLCLSQLVTDCYT